MSKLDNLKSILQDLTPPLLWRSLRWIIKGQYYIEWEYIPEGWLAQKNNPKIKGWNVESVLEAYKSRWPTFLKNLEGTLPFGITLESDSDDRCNLSWHNILITYAYALALAAHKKVSISMLDWGGGIGHYYLLSQKLIPNLEIDYHCKDTPVLVEWGRSLIPDAHFYTDSACLARKYEFVLASGSLQYSPDWVSTLKDLASVTNGYLFVTRLPIVFQADSYVMVQRPYQHGYNTEYLGWCFSRPELIKVANNLGLNLIREFVIEPSPHVYRAPEQPTYWGFLFSQEQPQA